MNNGDGAWGRKGKEMVTVSGGVGGGRVGLLGKKRRRRRAVCTVGCREERMRELREMGEGGSWIAGGGDGSEVVIWWCLMKDRGGEGWF